MRTVERPDQPCPSCAGPRLAHHPAGPVWRHAVQCVLLRAEDATRAADHERLTSQPRQIGGAHPFTRPTTAAERTLMAAAGHPVPDGASTVVTVLTTGLVHRAVGGVHLDPTT